VQQKNAGAMRIAALDIDGYNLAVIIDVPIAKGANSGVCSDTERPRNIACASYFRNFGRGGTLQNFIEDEDEKI
jgi:hypothetical protein